MYSPSKFSAQSCAKITELRFSAPLFAPRATPARSYYPPPALYYLHTNHQSRTTVSFIHAGKTISTDSLQDINPPDEVPLRRRAGLNLFTTVVKPISPECDYDTSNRFAYIASTATGTSSSSHNSPYILAPPSSHIYDENLNNNNNN